MTQEITIHRSLNHPNIVKFHGFFEDNFNIYIILELCKKRVSRQNINAACYLTLFLPNSFTHLSLA